METLIKIKLSYLVIIVDSGLLVLLVLGDQVVHVGLCLSELHLVHAFASVPVEESLVIGSHLYTEQVFISLM